ncbi:MAG: dienelactone hydrolase family protein [Candidatus Binatia bacterium]
MAEDLKYLMESYRAGTITRREFLRRAVLWTGSMAVASSLLDSLSPAAVHAANQVDPNDPALISTDVKYTAADGASINAYVTRPKGDGRRPAVIVISDNLALDDHNRDIGRRLAKAGYVAIVPDVVSREGGTNSFPNREAVAQAISKLNDDNLMKDLMGAQNYIKGQSFVQANKIGVVGFCWGGGKTFLFTTQSKDLAATVIFYGPIPKDLDAVKNITAPVLGNYGELDKPISSQVPRLAEEMKKNGKSYDYKIYPDAPHAFYSDVREDRYRPEAAKDAWGRTLEFFKKHLQG